MNFIFDFWKRFFLPIRLYTDSGGQSSTQTVTNELPAYAQPYYTDLMNRAQAQSNAPYQTYDAQRLQGFTPDQLASFQQVQNMQAPSQIGQATSLTNQAAQGAMGNANFSTPTIQSNYNPQQSQMYGSPDAVQSQFTPGTFGANQAQQYMSPYQQNVTDASKASANRTFAQQQVAGDAGAAARGAFGGSRAALVSQEAQSNQNNLLNSIQTTGNQQAYQNAQQQFNTDQQSQLAGNAQGLGAQQFNTQQQQQYGQAGMQNQQFNINQQQQAAGMNLQAQQANATAQANAAGIQNSSNALAGSMANQLGNLGTAQQTLDLQRAQALNQVGTQQQQLGQSALDTSYNDFVNQRDYNNQQLSRLSGLLHGVPVTANSDVVTNTPQGNPLGQTAGLGIAALGAYNAATK